MPNTEPSHSKSTPFKNFITQLTKLKRSEKLVLQLFTDIFLASASLVLTAFLVDYEIFTALESNYFLILASVVSTTVLATYLLGVYAVSVRFITGGILKRIACVSLIVSGFLSIFTIDLGLISTTKVLLIHSLTLFLFLGSVRFGARFLFRKLEHIHGKEIAIYGAGEAGRQVVYSLFHSKDFMPVAFVDDDLQKWGLTIAGLPVFPLSKIAEIKKEFNIDTILLAATNMTKSRRLEVLDETQNLGLGLKTIPSTNEILKEPTKVSEIRDVQAEDILGRHAIEPINQLMGKTIKKRVVLVTGAGGSIGSELCRQVLLQQPSELILFELSESALYQVEVELLEMLENLEQSTNLVAILGSVNDKDYLLRIFSEHKVETIFHAAAYKHVPLLEKNVFSAALNNVFGTLSITSAAAEIGVKNFILISTDKAVRPTNVMGATKRIAELILQSFNAEEYPTTFSMARFGNVLGSSGSVIPRFTKQISEGGPVTVTHPEITRYFMTIPEAASLVIQSSAMAQGGDVFLLDMGKPVKIVALASAMIKLSGYIPYFVTENDIDVAASPNKIAIKYTGLRPGEKLYEELLIENSSLNTDHPRIFKTNEKFIRLDVLTEYLSDLQQACNDFDKPALLKVLHDLPIDFKPDGNMNATDGISKGDLNYN